MAGCASTPIATEGDEVSATLPGGSKIYNGPRMCQHESEDRTSRTRCDVQWILDDMSGWAPACEASH